jgi:hypothetical protein
VKSRQLALEVPAPRKKNNSEHEVRLAPAISSLTGSEDGQANKQRPHLRVANLESRKRQFDHSTKL